MMMNTMKSETIPWSKWKYVFHLHNTFDFYTFIVSLPQEIQAQIQKVSSGNISLVSELGAMKLALRAAIANAFKTPDVIRMFAQKEPSALRERLAQIHQDWDLGRIKSKEQYKYGCHIQA